jgi:DMSO/TMAO reductase YedYZ molybdopterin-dependent catalytic subunit
VVGSGVLVALVGRAQRLSERPSAHAQGSSRRRFLISAAGAGALALVSGGLGVVLAGRRAAAAATGVAIPAPLEPAAALPAGTELGVEGVTPFYTPNDRFYRVDTALEVPIVDPATWRLRIHGMVDREVTLTLDELLQLPLVERDITLTCVSNQVGGNLAGNARWSGVPLATVLDEAGVRAGADQIVSRSVDGMTIGTPTAVALDGRDAMLAVSMNGSPLPPAHGAPVRMIVPGLFGYVSATKWLVELELTTFDAFDPYWVERGWAAKAPILTMTRIDTPRPLARLASGEIAVAGVAWAQGRGIDAVEVRVDDGPWQRATLAPVPSVDTWRQWLWPWRPEPGRHRLEARATDGAGETQTGDRAEPFPSGATGWHSVVVTVE